MSTRYIPARSDLDVCGDWYDVAAVDPAVMGVVVGDVVGHGLAAAAVMGQLRGAAAAALQLEAGPAAAMGVLERRARSVDGAQGTTCFAAVIDAAAGTMTYCNAGQVPPLLVRPDGRIAELDGARSPVLCAVDHDVAHPEATVEFGPGSVLVAFIDGLVERAGEDISLGYDRLRRALRAPPVDVDHYADALLAAALHHHARTDDLALVVVCHSPYALRPRRACGSG